MKTFYFARARLTVDTFRVEAETQEDAANLVTRGKVREFNTDDQALCRLLSASDHIVKDDVIEINKNLCFTPKRKV